MVSIRFSVLLVASAILASSSSAQQKPYSPDLYDRSALLAEDDVRAPASRAFVRASRPYAPNLFDRSSLLDEDEVQVIRKRSISENTVPMIARSAASPSSSVWNPFAKRSEESEEDLHERGLVADSVIEARGWCGSDRDCSGSHYCSSRKHQCYRKLNDYSHCSRDGACGSGYCCESDSVCKPQRKIGSKCHGNDSACNTGYCSVVTNKCFPQSKQHEGCRVDQGCKGSLSCVNGKCEDHKQKPSHPTKPNNPDHPSPSGSAKHPRSLSHTEV